MLFTTQVSAGKVAVANAQDDRSISTLELGAQKSDKYPQVFPMNFEEI